jgi:UPF0755 protein
MRLFKILLLLIFCGFSFYGPYVAFLNDSPRLKADIIDIYPGDSINASINKISSDNLINKIFIKLYLMSNDIDDFKAGEYGIQNKKIKDIIDEMANGRTITHKFVILEGTNIYELEKQINNSYLTNDCSYLTCIETSFPFYEGILYPDTYFYKKGMDSSNILKNSHKRMSDFVESLELNKSISLNKNELLILASIIEKEAGNELEKDLIASVFLKRLSIDMKLQADPTIIYGLLPDFDGDIKKSDILSKDNKYNTYMIKGLPPTPIAISSKGSILAVFNATPGDYLYFVANSPKSHYFSKTYEEHLNKIKELGLDR